MREESGNRVRRSQSRHSTHIEASPNFGREAEATWRNTILIKRSFGAGIVLAVVLWQLGGSCSAATSSQQVPLNPALVAARWPASWIAFPNVPGGEPGVFYFRREITLTSVPAHYWVHVSADNRYLLHVNGKYAAEGPARGDLFHWRFETVDLASLLHPGRNVLAAIVWNFGELAPVAQMSSRTGFLLQGDTAAEAAANSGKDWQVKREPGRAALGHDGAHGYYAAGPAEKVDGRVLDFSWDQPQTDSSGWTTPQVLSRASTREAQDAPNAWELVQDLLPPMEHTPVDVGAAVRADGVTPLPNFPVAPLQVPANAHVTLLLDHRTLQTAYPELDVSGGRDAEIRMTYSEALYDAHGDKGNRNEVAGRHIDGITDEFLSGGQDHAVFQPLWWRTWRYLQIEVTTKAEPLTLNAMHAWFTAYPFKDNAKVSGDIRDLDRLWETGWRTARLDAHETYMDAPYWEQLQYVGDTRIQALISYVVSGDPRLARQAITNIDDSRTIEGITESRYPSGLPQFIPTFSLLWINMLHDYWMYVDDLPLVQETLPHTRTVIDWYAARLRADGLLGRVRWWEFADWTANYPDGVPPQEADGGSAFLTLQFIEGLQAAEELETKYGSRERAGQYREMIQRASAALNQENWDAEHGLYADTPTKKSWSEQANVLAVLLDVAPRAEQQSILRRVLAAKPKESTTVEGKTIPPLSDPSFYFRFYLHRALTHSGLGDLYLEQLGPWYGMLDLGLSTWAETPEPTRSDCHAWSASPNYDLLTIVAGIAPAEPGFRKVRIEPHLKGLHQFHASMPHPAGTIETSYRLDGEHWSAKLTLPRGVDGELVWKGKITPLHAGEQEVQLP
ncbi:alpha-L-rhamnosidase [Acidobacteria bacterium AB60]|nr:alpha-L-rhamnosidase [Acidobacteria bacterium AB60]